MDRIPSVILSFVILFAAVLFVSCRAAYSYGDYSAREKFQERVEKLERENAKLGWDITEYKMALAAYEHDQDLCGEKR